MAPGRSEPERCNNTTSEGVLSTLICCLPGSIVAWCEEKSHTASAACISTFGQDKLGLSVAQIRSAWCFRNPCKHATSCYSASSCLLRAQVAVVYPAVAGASAELAVRPKDLPMPLCGSRRKGPCSALQHHVEPD